MRPLLGPARLRHRSPATTGARCRAPRPSSSATTSAWSTTTSRTATSSGATARRSGRVHGVPAGDQHRRHAVQPVADRPPPADRPRLLGREGPAADAPVRRDLPRAVRGPVPRHRDERVGRRSMTVELLLRHDRAQDRGAHRRLDRGRRPARDRRRDGHRPLSRRSAGRSGSPSSSTTTCSASGAPSGRPARSRRTSPTARRRCRSSTPTSTPAPRTGRASPSSYATAGPRAPTEVAEIIAILERTGAREYTRDQARRYRDEALAELDAAGVVEPGRPRAPRADHRLGDQRLIAAAGGDRADPAAPQARRNRPIANPIDGAAPGRVAVVGTPGSARGTTSRSRIVGRSATAHGLDRRPRRPPRRHPTRRSRRARPTRGSSPAATAPAPVEPRPTAFAGSSSRVMPNAASPSGRRVRHPDAVREDHLAARADDRREERERVRPASPDDPGRPHRDREVDRATGEQRAGRVGIDQRQPRRDAGRLGRGACVGEEPRVAVEPLGARRRPPPKQADQQVGLAAAELDDPGARREVESVDEGVQPRRRRSDRGSTGRRGRSSRTGAGRRTRARPRAPIGRPRRPRGRAARGRPAPCRPAGRRSSRRSASARRPRPGRPAWARRRSGGR